MNILAPGQLFAGRYRIERHLAKGGMGAVYVATHLETEAQVALKVLLPHRLHSPDARARFRSEAKVAARVQSDHIVRVHDAGMDEATDMPFLAMELLEGCSLAEEIGTRGRRSRAEALVLMRQIASGLDRAHGHRDPSGAPRPIVHRDLKPDNLFLSQRDDGSPLVKILDFGLAKVLHEEALMSAEIKGTPEYMAFEQLRGEAVSPRTDVWPLGLIAFYMLSGRSYWRTISSPDSNVQALFAELLQPYKERPSERIQQLGLAPNWPAAFDDWFLCCVAARPDERFASAGEAVAALQLALQAPSQTPSQTVSALEGSATLSLSQEVPTRHLVAQPDRRTTTVRPARRTAPPPAGTGPRSQPPTSSRRGGDERSGFDVSVVPGRRVLRLCCWGMWNDGMAAEYAAAVRAGMAFMATLDSPWYVLGEISRYPAQRSEVASVHGQLMQEASGLGMRRACSVVSSMLTRMQIHRLAEESYMPAVAFFIEESDAIDWVTRDIADP